MNLELNCAPIVDNCKEIDIPPKDAKTYPTEVGVKALKEYIEKGGEVLVIPAERKIEVERE